MNRNLIIHLSFLIFAVLYVAVLFLKIPQNNFLYIGDQFFRFSKDETFANAFYLRKMMNFSVFNAWQLTVQTPDILYYSIVYKLGFNLINAEKILFALIIFITMSFSFTGFSKLSKLYIGEANTKVLLAITFWYSINPYMMVLWHGAVYNFGSSLTYALAPLIIYYFHLSLVNFKATRARIICALLMFTASFTFWMFAAIVVLLILYTIALFIINRKLIGVAIINGMKLLAIYVPMAAMIIYPIFHEYANNKLDLNGTFAATFGNIQGGLLYQLLMYFSWGIYTLWEPRSIYPKIVTDFYFSPIYIGATILLYLLLGFLLFQKLEIVKWNKKDFVKQNYLFIIYIVIFFVSIFLAKGQEPPFGGIFLYLYEHMPFFTVFRSSDHRFGFPAVLSLSIALLILTKDLKKTNVFVIALLVITFIQNFIFFTGDLIIGQNLGKSFVDRVVYISKPYEELANYINSQKDTYYILPNPSLEYGTFNFDKNEKHMGQDLLPKLINKPFADVPLVSGMQIQTGIVLTSIVQQDLPEGLTLLPVKYVLQRRDVECPTCKTFSEDKIAKISDKEFENELFTLYKVKNYTPLINSNVQTIYKEIDPVRYEAEIKNIKEIAQLNFMESYNANWKLYLLPYSEMNCTDLVNINQTTSECPKSIGAINMSDANVTNNPELKLRAFPQNLTHTNVWNISGASISNQYGSSFYKKNEDGTYNVKVAIFYAPQSTYIFAVFITIISVIISITALFLPASLMRKFRIN